MALKGRDLIHTVKLRAVINQVNTTKIAVQMFIDKYGAFPGSLNNASEIIHIGQAVMNSPNNTIKYFVETTFNYPTMAEAYRVATLNGMNRLF